MAENLKSVKGYYIRESKEFMSRTSYMTISIKFFKNEFDQVN